MKFFRTFCGTYQAAQCLALFVMLGVLLGALPLAFSAPRMASGLVYCPLQKKWVPPAKAAAAPKEPLVEICAPEKSKSDFLLVGARNIQAAKAAFDKAQNEELFFSYVQKGRAAFAALGSPNELPPSSLAKTSKNEKATASSQSDFSKKAVAAGLLRQLARPPTRPASIPVYHSRHTAELSSVTRRIRPRAPPFYL